MNSEKNNYFHFKGKKAEEHVHRLATKSFLFDWCFLNPKLPNGKELCDLLVVFDNKAIIWQIKDLKLKQDGKYKISEVEKNIKQVSGARRKLFDLKVNLSLENSRQKIEQFDSSTITEIYLISVIMGKGEIFSNLVEEIKKHTVHALTTESVEILLNELDTVMDFTDYLKEKEKLINRKQKLIVNGGEKELLAFYLLNDRSFERLKNVDSIMIEEGSWDDFQNRPYVRSKKEEDKFSYGWDSIINRAHEGSSKYEIVAKELARPNRFQRRVLGKAYFEAYLAADRDTENDLFRRIQSLDGVTYCYLFLDDVHPDNENRKLMLESLCWVAWKIFSENTKVIGIATEKISRSTCSYDFCLMDKTDWTEEDKAKAHKIQNDSGIFINPKLQSHDEEEYPNSREY